MDNLNEKYREIVNQGKILFWKHGIKKVTVEEICEKAGTSRVTFYKYFQNKEQLAYSILKSIIDGSFREYRDIMESDENFQVKVRQTIKFKMKYSSQMSHELLNDIMGGDFPDILKLITDAREKSFRMVQDDYSKAQKDGNIRKDVKIEFVLYFLNKMQEMISDPELEKVYPDTGELISELIRFFFYGLLPRNSENTH